MRIAIYDLDRTLTKQPTFTPFLAFAARRYSPARLLLLPVWVLAMLFYRLGLYDRTALKKFGMHLMVANPTTDRVARMGEAFAAHRVATSGFLPGALRSLATERAGGARIIVATAAFGFYAAAIARELGIEEVVATRWDGKGIPGRNNYGATKLERVLAHLEQGGLRRGDCDIVAFSDSLADAPLLDWADEGVLVGAGSKIEARARQHGWRHADWTR